SYFATYIAPRGLDLVYVSYDAYADVHTERTQKHVALDEVVLPDVEELAHAMQHCTGTTCTSDDHAFRFTFKPTSAGVLLTQLAIDDLPPCHDSAAIPQP